MKYYNCILVVLVLCCYCCVSVSAGVLNCPALPPHTPKSIHDLRPNDIKVIMALGDSITAAFGVMGADGGLNEFRGKSWSIGGDDNATTVPNFLKTWVPNIQGAAKGQHLLEYCAGPQCPNFQYHPVVDVHNAAQSGAMIMNLPTHEMDYLLKQIYANPNIDIANDWKLLTILIGANDICSCCDLNATYTGPDAFESDIRSVLEKIRSTLPRTFVNLVLGFNISDVYWLGRKSVYCELHQRVFSFECECIFDKDANKTRLEVDVVTQQYNQRLVKIEAEYKAKNYSDFAAVIQPFLINTQAINFPTSFLSTFDCFHPSLLAHESFAIGLWNNMLTPAAKKQKVLNLGDVPMCPSSTTLIYTN